MVAADLPTTICGWLNKTKGNVKRQSLSEKNECVDREIEK
jgi:hypothetical protein